VTRFIDIHTASHALSTAVRNLRLVPDDPKAARRIRRTDRQRVLRALAAVRKFLDRSYPEIRRPMKGQKKRATTPAERNRRMIKLGYVSLASISETRISMIALLATAGVKLKTVRWKEPAVVHGKGCPILRSPFACAGRATQCKTKMVERTSTWAPGWVTEAKGDPEILRKLVRATPQKRKALIAAMRLGGRPVLRGGGA
jgi:hypothetical protein